LFLSFQNIGRFRPENPDPARGQAAIRGGGVGGSVKRSSAHSFEDFQEMVSKAGMGSRAFAKSAIKGMAAVETGQVLQPQETGGKVSH